MDLRVSRVKCGSVDDLPLAVVLDDQDIAAARRIKGEDVACEGGSAVAPLQDKKGFSLAGLHNMHDFGNHERLHLYRLGYAPHAVRWTKKLIFIAIL